MDNRTEKVKNMVAKTKDRIIYLHNEGVRVETKKGISASFKFGMNIQSELFFPYTLENEHFEDDCYPLYLFFDEAFRVWTQKDKETIIGIGDSISFIFDGQDLIGMDFDKFMQLDILHFDYVEEKYYGPPTGDGVNFRYYNVYYNIKHQMIAYVWRRKIREITLRDTFFLQKKYEDLEYLEEFGIMKIKDLQGRDSV